MTKKQPSPQEIANSLAAELFAGAQESAVIINYAEIELANLPNALKNRQLKTLDSAKAVTLKADNSEKILELVNRFQEDGVVGLYFFTTSAEAAQILLPTFKSIMENRTADGYDICNLTSQIRLLQIWVDR